MQNKKKLEKPGEQRRADKQNRGNSKVSTGITNFFTFLKCGITINQNRLRKSQAKLCGIWER
jgi:flagellar biosynthesis protein FlhB